MLPGVIHSVWLVVLKLVSIFMLEQWLLVAWQLYPRNNPVHNPWEITSVIFTLIYLVLEVLPYISQTYARVVSMSSNCQQSLFPKLLNYPFKESESKSTRRKKNPTCVQVIKSVLLWSHSMPWLKRRNYDSMSMYSICLFFWTFQPNLMGLLCGWTQQTGWRQLASLLALHMDQFEQVFLFVSP